MRSRILFASSGNMGLAGDFVRCFFSVGVLKIYCTLNSFTPFARDFVQPISYCEYHGLKRIVLPSGFTMREIWSYALRPGRGTQSSLGVKGKSARNSLDSMAFNWSLVNPPVKY